MRLQPIDMMRFPYGNIDHSNRLRVVSRERIIMTRKVAVPLFIGAVGGITGLLSYLSDRKEVQHLIDQAKSVISVN